MPTPYMDGMTNNFNPDQPRGTPKNKGSWSANDNANPEVTLGTSVEAVESAANPEVSLAAVNVLQLRYDTLDEKLAVMAAASLERQEALKTDEAWNESLRVMASYPRYSYPNQGLIDMQLKGGGLVGGKKFWRSLGRSVDDFETRGSGISILAPKKGWFDKKDAAGNVMKGTNGKPLKELHTFGFTTCTVYSEAQTSGDPIPRPQRELSEEPPAGFIEDLETAIAARGFTVTYDDSLGKDATYGSTNGTTMQVRVKAGLPLGSRAQVLAHELGHIVAGHIDKIDEYHTGPGGQRGRHEIEAESISGVLLELNGMKTGNDVTTTYIAGWARVQRDDPDVMKNAMETVAHSVKDLVVKGSWRNSTA